MFTIIIQLHIITMILLYYLLIATIRMNLNYDVNSICHQTEVNHATNTYHKRIKLQKHKKYLICIPRCDPLYLNPHRKIRINHFTMAVFQVTIL